MLRLPENTRLFKGSNPTKDDPVYESVIDGNIWSPEAYPAGWEVEA